MAKRRALITGISGQDGTYLAESLARHDVEVWGISRGAPSARVLAVANVRSLDVLDAAAVDGVIREVLPDECYHLSAYHRSSQVTPASAVPAASPASASPVISAFDDRDEDTLYLRTNLLATSTLLSSLRRHQPRCRIFLAGSCHMFGEPDDLPQTETTSFAPNSLYGITKVASAQLGQVYRQRDQMFCASGILYNHESPLRGPGFITTRLAQAAVAISRGRAREVVVGNLEAEVDWGFAGDYVEAMRLMMAAPHPRDYVIATGTLHRIRDFARIAFGHVGLDWSRHVRQEATAHRPVSRVVYRGAPDKIERELGWRRKVAFPELVAMMVDHHLTLPADSPP